MARRKPRAAGPGDSLRAGPNEVTDVIPAITDLDIDEDPDEGFDAEGPVFDTDPDDTDLEDSDRSDTGGAGTDLRDALAARALRLGRAAQVRWPQLSAAIGGGLLLWLSFPPIGWWFTPFGGFALLAWVLTRSSTTAAGGFGYGFLFGLAFYVPLLPWIGGLV
ncbi:MAG TPA: apolipoprotein N-acyltransferase, partial [Mycobacterium sp.]|nr:apolipoprotein N-acyltransferase [Mycobacterium sp.]